jgi:hypothetical protein
MKPLSINLKNNSSRIARHVEPGVLVSKKGISSKEGIKIDRLNNEVDSDTSSSDRRRNNFDRTCKKGIKRLNRIRESVAKVAKPNSGREYDGCL